MISPFCIDFQVTDFPPAKHLLQSPQELHSVPVNAGSRQRESDSSTLLHKQDTPHSSAREQILQGQPSITPQATATHPACD